MQDVACLMAEMDASLLTCHACLLDDDHSCSVVCHCFVCHCDTHIDPCLMRMYYLLQGSFLF